MCSAILACSDEQNTITNEHQQSGSGFNTVDSGVEPPPRLTNDLVIEQSNQRFEIDNKHYLFDVNDHTIEELQDLLERIEEITEASPEAFDDLKLVMVLHGPDINLFTKKNYLENKSIVDLAAKLDAFEIVDMKVCDTAIDKLGFDRKEIPAFIESVPYAPDTMRSLQEQGYINL